jgi:hypothetical protein
MRITKESIDIAGRVVAEIAANGGRAADGGISLPFLISMAQAAGDGDHVDIGTLYGASVGTLYGASAIGVALMKKETGQKGDVYCIDPYDDETRDANVHGNEGLSTPVSASEEALMHNAEHFGVELKLIKKYSHPWPEELEENTFASAYIDGDHVADGPRNDFNNLAGRVSGYIGTDNFEEEYPDVVASMLEAMDTDEWFLLYKNLIFIALRRVLPMRSDETYPQIVLAK